MSSVHCNLDCIPAFVVFPIRKSCFKYWPPHIPVTVFAVVELQFFTVWSPFYALLILWISHAKLISLFNCKKQFKRNYIRMHIMLSNRIQRIRASLAITYLNYNSMCIMLIYMRSDSFHVSSLASVSYYSNCLQNSSITIYILLYIHYHPQYIRSSHQKITWKKKNMNFMQWIPWKRNGVFGSVKRKKKKDCMCTELILFRIDVFRKLALL